MGQHMTIVLEEIKQANDLELNDMILAVVKRHKVLFPNWELHILSLPKHDLEERRRIVESEFEFLKRHNQI